MDPESVVLISISSVGGRHVRPRLAHSADWRAVRDLIVVATHGAPDTLSCLDEEWQAMTGRDRY